MKSTDGGTTAPIDHRDLGRYLLLGCADADAGTDADTDADTDAGRDRPCADCALLWWNDRLRATGQARSADVPLLFADLESALLCARRASDTHPLSGGHPPRRPAGGRITVFDRLTGELTDHAVVTHPACLRCSSDHRTDPQGIDAALQQPATLVGDSWRIRPIDTESLRGLLVEPTWGPVFGLLPEEDSEACLVRAPISLPGQGVMAAGYGRGSTFVSSQGPALVEALERLVSAAPVEPATRVVVASQAQLGAKAFDVRRLGRHDPRYAHHPHSIVQPFDASTVTSWVAAWSTLERRVLRVPAHVAYWRTHDGLPKFVYSSSSGTATGGSVAEAVLYALFELIERDAFLLMWHARIPLVEAPWRHLPRAVRLSESLGARGMHLRVLDATTEFGVRVSVAVIDAEHGTVGLGRNRALNVAAGAHLDADLATTAAIDEAANNALMYAAWSRRMPAQFDPQRFHRMLADFGEVRVLEDHEGLFGLNEARHHWDFLRDSVPSPEPEPATSAHTSEAGADRDLPRVLATLMQRFHQLDMDVIIVNQSQLPTDPRHPLFTVRVIVPELLAMTFGHVHSRLFESERLENAHHSLVEALRPARVLATPVPHPFP